MSFYAQSQITSMTRLLRYIACFSEYPHIRCPLSVDSNSFVSGGRGTDAWWSLSSFIPRPVKNVDGSL